MEMDRRQRGTIWETQFGTINFELLIGWPNEGFKEPWAKETEQNWKCIWTLLAYTWTLFIGCGPYPDTWRSWLTDVLRKHVPGIENKTFAHRASSPNPSPQTWSLKSGNECDSEEMRDECRRKMPEGWVPCYTRISELEYKEDLMKEIAEASRKAEKQPQNLDRCSDYT